MELFNVKLMLIRMNGNENGKRVCFIGKRSIYHSALIFLYTFAVIALSSPRHLIGFICHSVMLCMHNMIFEYKYCVTVFENDLFYGFGAIEYQDRKRKTLNGLFRITHHLLAI